MDRIFTATIYPYGSSAARNSSWGSILLPAVVFEGCTISCRRAARTCQPTTCTLDSGPRGREGGSCHREQSLFLVWAVNLLNTATIHRGLISESAIHLLYFTVFVLSTVCLLTCPCPTSMGADGGGCHIIVSWAPVWDSSLSCPHIWTSL